MPVIVKQPEGGKDFEPIPEGQYTARCFKVVDLGTQTEEYKGEIKFMPKVMITWEILDEPKMEDGRPFAISRTYTASLSEKSNLYKDLVSWRGKKFTEEELLGFDVSNLLGAYCQIQVVHTKSKDGERTYANLNAIMGTKEKPKAINDEVLFTLDNPDMDIYEDFSDYVKGKIQSSKEWQASHPAKPSSPVADPVIEDIQDEPINVNDIPFGGDDNPPLNEK